MIRYYQLLLKNKEIGYCHIVGASDIIMTHSQVCSFKRANEPHSFENYYYEIVVIPLDEINKYKPLTPTTNTI